MPKLKNKKSSDKDLIYIKICDWEDIYPHDFIGNKKKNVMLAVRISISEKSACPYIINIPD